MEHKTAFLYLEAGIILEWGGEKLPFNSAEIHTPSPHFHSPWNSPVSTIRMKMRVTLSGGNGFQSSSVKVWRALYGDEGGKGLSPKPADLVVVTLWDWGASWVDLFKQSQVCGDVRETEYKGLGKFKAVMPLGYVLLSGLQGGTSLLH